MPGLRKLTSPALALLCLVLFGAAANSQKATQAEKIPPFVDEEDVVVKPRGGNVPKGGEKGGIAPYGFAWLHGPNRDPMTNGAPTQYRCDLYHHLYWLQVKQTSEGPYENADAVHFILENKEFGVTKTNGDKYIWYNLHESPADCYKEGLNTCRGNGVPTGFMDGHAADGTIWARLANSGEWKPVVEVLMRGKKCH